MDYFIIMIYQFLYRIKLHNAITWFLFELYSKNFLFTQWVKTKFPFPLNVLSPIPSTKIPVPVDLMPFSHTYFRPIPVPFLKPLQDPRNTMNLSLLITFTFLAKLRGWKFPLSATDVFFFLWLPEVRKTKFRVEIIPTARDAVEASDVGFVERTLLKWQTSLA